MLNINPLYTGTYQLPSDGTFPKTFSDSCVDTGAGVNTCK